MQNKLLCSLIAITLSACAHGSSIDPEALPKPPESDHVWTMYTRACPVASPSRLGVYSCESEWMEEVLQEEPAQQPLLADFGGWSCRTDGVQEGIYPLASERLTVRCTHTSGATWLSTVVCQDGSDDEFLSTLSDLGETEFVEVMILCQAVE